MKITVSGLLLLITSVVSMPAAAYIDPGSGSAIMSAVIGFFVAVAMAVKTYWYKIKAFFGGGKANSSDVLTEGDIDASRADKVVDSDDSADTDNKGNAG